VGGLSHFLEEEGLPTTHISLVREQTQVIRPPRALWVPFELGRPLGPPNEPAFQKRVLLAALRLLEAEAGPVLEDFPEDEPALAGPAAPIACPVNFGPPPGESEPLAALGRALAAEVDGLSSWHHLAVEARGRSLAEASGLEPAAVARFLGGFLDGRIPANPRPDLPLPVVIKLAVEDLKTYYLEAASAQPGKASSRQMANWFWGQTAAARVLAEVNKVCLMSQDKAMRHLGELLIIPRSQAHRFPKE